MITPRARGFMIALVAMFMIFAQPISSFAQDATPVSSDQAACANVSVPDGFGCTVQADGTIAIVEAPSPCQNITVPAGMECVVHDDGSIEIVQAATASSEVSTAAEAPAAPATTATTASNAAGPINVNNQTNVDVDVVNQVDAGSGAGRVPFPGDCPDTLTVQQTLDAPVSSVAGGFGECAFNFSYGEVRQITAAPGWVFTLQAKSDAVIVFEGDGRRYNTKAVTARIGRSVCDIWAGQYLWEVNVDDPNGVGYDTYVALPRSLKTCTVNGTDAWTIGRVSDLSALDQIVYDPSTTVMAASEPVQATDVQGTSFEAQTSPDQTAVATTPVDATQPQVTVTQDTTMAPATATPVETAQPVADATPVAAAAPAGCPTDAQSIAQELGIPELANGNWTPASDGGIVYLGNPVTFTVPVGLAVFDGKIHRANENPEVSSGNFTFYCERG